MRNYLWLLIALLGVGLVLAGRHQLKARGHWRPTALVLSPQSLWVNVTPGQRQGFGALFKDCLEYGGKVPLVEQEAAMPRRAGDLDSLELQVTREGDRIRIRVLRRRVGLPLAILETGPEPPAKAIASVLEALGLETGGVRLMIPRNPETFWTLAEVADWRVEEDLTQAMQACVGLAEREPECSSVWLAKARIANYFLLQNSAVEPDTQQQCEGDFIRALEIAPDYPRAVTAFARFKTDIGNQHGALGLLFGAIQHSPRTPRLFEGIAYAARTSGLLEGARLALQQRDLLVGLSRGEAGLTENTYLYLGDLDAFEGVLGVGSAGEPDSVRDFYRGYARLLRGDRPGAETFFARAYLHPSGIPQFETLARVYHLGLQGKPEAALGLLRKLWAERVPLRVPDGEFTFKLAEAFGFLGSQAEAQDVATRAFAQGFGCTRWYQESPLLAGVRGTPRWTALQQHLLDRQGLAQRIFPKERFLF